MELSVVVRVNIFINSHCRDPVLRFLKNPKGNARQS